MKSKWSKVGFPFDEDEKEYFKIIAKLSKDDFTNILNIYKRRFEDGLELRTVDLENVSIATDSSTIDVISAFKILSAIISRCFIELDDLKDIFDDLVESKSIEEEYKAIILERCTIMGEELGAELQHRTLKHQAVSFLRNRLMWLGIKIEIVPKFEPNFERSKYSVETYQPKISHLFPVCNLQLSYENTDGKDEKFSCVIYDETTLDLIIDQLLVTKIQLNESKKLIQSLINNNK